MSCKDFQFFISLEWKQKILLVFKIKFSKSENNYYKSVLVKLIIGCWVRKNRDKAEGA